MSKRVATTVTLSVRIPLAPGRHVKDTVKLVEQCLKQEKLFDFSNQIIIKVAKRETTYL